MVGGVLVERTVKEVVPALVNNRDKVTEHFEVLLPVVINHHSSDGKTDWKPGKATDREGRRDQWIYGEAPDSGQLID